MNLAKYNNKFTRYGGKLVRFAESSTKDEPMFIVSSLGWMTDSNGYSYYVDYLFSDSASEYPDSYPYVKSEWFEGTGAFVVGKSYKATVGGLELTGVCEEYEEGSDDTWLLLKDDNDIYELSIRYTVSDKSYGLSLLCSLDVNNGDKPDDAYTINIYEA